MLPESFGGRIIYLLQQYGSSFAKGAGVSMWLALVGTLFGCIIGFLVGIVQTIPVDKNDSTAKKILTKIVKFILACYVEFFRGTPMMAQAMFIYFGSAAVFNINMSMWFAAIFIVSINTCIYGRDCPWRNPFNRSGTDRRCKSNRYDTCTDHDQCHSSAGTSKYYATDRQ